MKLISAIDGWFKKREYDVDALLKRIEPLVEKAEPIVEEISAVATQAAIDFPEVAPEAAMVAAISAYLRKAVTVEGVVDTFLVANAHVPVHNLLHNAAVLALQYSSGETSVVISDLDTAAQLAYSATKKPAA